MATQLITAVPLRVYGALSAHDSYASTLATKNLCDRILGIIPGGLGGAPLDLLMRDGSVRFVGTSLALGVKKTNACGELV